MIWQQMMSNKGFSNHYSRVFFVFYKFHLSLILTYNTHLFSPYVVTCCNGNFVMLSCCHVVMFHETLSQNVSLNSNFTVSLCVTFYQNRKRQRVSREFPVSFCDVLRLCSMTWVFSSNVTHLHLQFVTNLDVLFCRFT